MTDLVHDRRLEFPNGQGYTPCTTEYFFTKGQRDDICNVQNGDSIHDLPRDLYQLYSELDHKLGVLQIAGHLGKSVRY